jgi:hypothetical protein
MMSHTRSAAIPGKDVPAYERWHFGLPGVALRLYSKPPFYSKERDDIL